MRITDRYGFAFWPNSSSTCQPMTIIPPSAAIRCWHRLLLMTPRSSHHDIVILSLNGIHWCTAPNYLISSYRQVTPPPPATTPSNIHRSEHTLEIHAFRIFTIVIDILSLAQLNLLHETTASPVTAKSRPLHHSQWNSLKYRTKPPHL